MTWNEYPLQIWGSIVGTLFFYVPLCGNFFTLVINSYRRDESQRRDHRGGDETRKLHQRSFYCVSHEWLESSVLFEGTWLGNRVQKTDSDCGRKERIGSGLGILSDGVRIDVPRLEERMDRRLAE